MARWNGVSRREVRRAAARSVDRAWAGQMPPCVDDEQTEAEERITEDLVPLLKASLARVEDEVGITPVLHSTLEVYYRGDPAYRERSPEVDFGVWWAEARGFPRYRVSWVQGTGELYALNHTTGAVTILAVLPTREEADCVLAGWGEHCGPGGMEWLRAVVRAAGYGPHVALATARCRQARTAFDQWKARRRHPSSQVLS